MRCEGDKMKKLSIDFYCMYPKCSGSIRTILKSSSDDTMPLKCAVLKCSVCGNNSPYSNIVGIKEV